MAVKAIKPVLIPARHNFFHRQSCLPAGRALNFIGASFNFPNVFFENSGGIYSDWWLAGRATSPGFV
jgi:hypothetical protein